MMSEGNVKNRTIKVDALARVEGEGALYVKVSGGVVKDVRLDIYEPPRFFEAFLRGRSHKEPPDITARICGICPVAYQISSCNAIEDACGVKVDGQLRRLRRLLYCGEWIQSHALHVYMLHAPDFFGYQDALQLAKDHPEIVKRGLELKKTGNELMEVVGGRAVHPINVRVGGFYRVPTESQLSGLRDRLARALEASLETVRWVAGFDFPDFTQDYEFVALRHPEEYAIEDGILVSDRGLSIEAAEFESHVEEEHVAHSNALHARIKERGAYFVGPQARYSLNFDQLSPLAQQSARDAGLGSSCRNPFMSIVVRSVELV
ncbi:MAG: nickel-dependent hydrogenase large subunit [Trueperaceae bacterium]|nr:MAG: nickel-dependent hydrogenase large subunit [Trueperaceae bacterium]